MTAEAPTPLDHHPGGGEHQEGSGRHAGDRPDPPGIAVLAPGLTDNTPNAGQVTIAGSFAYDNVFLLDGVDINDNLFGNANNLFIEDAIEETQVLTSGISAEYGRFSGGVINAVTKQGGNKFSGSFRANFTQPLLAGRDARSRSRRAPSARDKLSKIYEATLGGPDRQGPALVLRGRPQGRRPTPSPRRQRAGIPSPSCSDQKRGEIKLTGAITPNHTLQATYTKVPDEHLPDALRVRGGHRPRRTRPTTASSRTSSLVANYNGVLEAEPLRRGAVLAEDVQLPEQRRHQHEHRRLALPRADHRVRAPTTPPTSTPPTPRTATTGRSPASLSYFLSTSSARQARHQGRLRELPLHAHRRQLAVLDRLRLLRGLAHRRRRQAGLRQQRLRDPGVHARASQHAINWLAVRGAQIDLTTQSVYVNDRWTLNNHWSVQPRRRAPSGRRARPPAASSRSTRAASCRAWARPSTCGATASSSWTPPTRTTPASTARPSSPTTRTSATPTRSTTSTRGPERPGPQLRAGLRPRQLHRRSSAAASPPRTSSTTRTSSRRSRRSGRRRRASQLGTRRLREGHLHPPQGQRLRAELRRHQHGHDRRGQERRRLRHVLEPALGQHQRRPAQVRRRRSSRAPTASPHRWNFAGNYTLQIKNDGNQEGEGANRRERLVLPRLLPRALQRGAHLPDRPAERLPAAPRCGPGRPTTSGSAGRQREPRPPVPLRLGPGLQHPLHRPGLHLGPEGDRQRALPRPPEHSQIVLLLAGTRAARTTRTRTSSTSR